MTTWNSQRTLTSPTPFPRVAIKSINDWCACFLPPKLFYRYGNNIYWGQNFDTFGSSILVLFAQMVVNNWYGWELYGLQTDEPLFFDEITYGAMKLGVTGRLWWKDVWPHIPLSTTTPKMLRPESTPTFMICHTLGGVLRRFMTRSVSSFRNCRIECQQVHSGGLLCGFAHPHVYYSDLDRIKRHNHVWYALHSGSHWA